MRDPGTTPERVTQAFAVEIAHTIVFADFWAAKGKPAKVIQKREEERAIRERASLAKRMPTDAQIAAAVVKGRADLARAQTEQAEEDAA